MVNLFINGIKIKVKKNTTVLQTCQNLNIDIPKFCFQDNLKIAGNCRMCLVEIKNSPKPVASCAITVMENMEIFTNSSLIKKAQESILEFLLLNHPLDCPICDQGGECDLQDQILNFGSDKTRFFEFKRGVEDKNFGPFIKTIMTRCIHCTRCIRFINEFSNVDFLGTIGRGKSTEISFYLQKNFTSEFSGNIIDLCPVGALTSKPYAFKTRPWELKNTNTIDILDGIGSNLKINTFNNEIIRILPRKNPLLNIEWISDKTRFFFDSLKYQRLDTPMIKINNKFKKISWIEAFKFIKLNKEKNDSNQMKFIIGNLTDLNSLFYFKKLINNLGVNNIMYHSSREIVNNDFNSNYLFNINLKNIKDSDLCLIIGCNPRREASILNIHLKNRFEKGNYTIYNIGSNLNFTYPITHLGVSFKILINILEGKHSFCKFFKKSKKPIIILGNDFLKEKNNFFLFNYLKKLLFLLFKNNIKIINTLQSEISFINFLEINFKQKKIINNKNIHFLFLYNTDLKYNKFKKLISNNPFIIYQGHHFTENAQNSNLILPGLLFLEKNSIYMNIEGLVQKTQKVLKIKNLQKCDKNIFKNLLNYFNFKIIDYLPLNNLYVYLKKNNIIIYNNYIKFYKYTIIFNTIFKKNNIKNNQTILEKYSRVLSQSHGIYKELTNFNYL